MLSAAASTATTSRATPRIGERERRHLAERHDELADGLPLERLAVRPRDELRDLVGEVVEVGVLPLRDDGVEQRAAEVAVDRDAVPRELLHDPVDHLLALDVVDEDVAVLRDGLRQRRVLAQLAGDEREHRARRGVGRVRRHGLDVVRAPAFDGVDDDEPLASEEPERVARRDGVVARTSPVPRAARSASGSKRSRSRRSARSIFGRSDPVSR